MTNVPMDIQTAESTTRLSMNDLWQILKRRRKFIALFVAICTAGVAGYSLVMPVTFSSGGSLMPPEGEKSGGLSSVLLNATGGGGLGGLGEIGQSGKSGRLVD